MKKWIVFIVTLVLAISLVACGAANEGNSEVDQNNTGQEQIDEQSDVSGEQSDDKQTVYPLTITDVSGLEMTFEQAPERIVSLSPSETEVLFALGLEDRIVGVTEWCDFPEAALSKPHVGSFDGNAETIIAVEPDFVLGILSLNNPEYIENYRGYGLTVFTVEPKTITGAMERILQIGLITNTLEQAEKIVEQMEIELNSVVDSVKGIDEALKKKVFIEYSEGWSVGKGEFADELITLAGGINIVDDVEGWVQISEEKVIQSNPDVILYPSYMEGIDTIIKERSGWDKISAIEHNQLASVNDDLVSRPGPRLTQGLIEVAKAIYPDLVK